MKLAAKRMGVIDLVEGFYLGHVVRLLLANDLLRLLQHRRSVEEISNMSGYRKEALRVCLDFVAQRTDVLTRVRGAYRLGRRYRTGQVGLFRLMKFFGAYGNVIMNLESGLRDSISANEFVGHEILADAYAEIARFPVTPVANAVSQAGATCLVEVGCGTAPVSREICKRDPTPRAYACDSNPVACGHARRMCRMEDLHERICILDAPFESLGAAIPADEHDHVDCVCFKGVLNAFVDTGAWKPLKQVKTHFPNALVVVADYYGRLGRDAPNDRMSGHAMCQDLVQSLTGQGVPPANGRGWEAIYRRAGYTVVQRTIHALEGVTTFVDTLRPMTFDESRTKPTRRPAPE